MRKVIAMAWIAFGLLSGMATTAAVYEFKGALFAPPRPCIMCGKLWIEFDNVNAAIQAANDLGGAEVKIGFGEFRIEEALPLPMAGTKLAAGGN